jgi:hypothetical protein
MEATGRSPGVILIGSTVAGWIIRNKKTGEVFRKTFARREARAINRFSRWLEAVPASRHFKELRDSTSRASRWARKAVHS